MYFFILSVAGTVSVVAADLVTTRTLLVAALMFPALIAGNALGDRWFDRASADVYRRSAMIVLGLLAVLAIGRAFAG